MVFWEVTDRLVEAEKTTYRWLAEKLDVPETTMSGWRRTGVEPRFSQGMGIAKALGVSPETLAGEDPADSWDLQNRRLIDAARRLSGDRLAVLTMIAETLAANPPAVSTGRVPVPSAAQLERELRDGLGLAAERPDEGYGH